MSALPLGFATQRLSVQNWTKALKSNEQRQAVEQALHLVLTPNVLRHLPPQLQLGSGPRAVSNWLSTLAREAELYGVSLTSAKRLIGVLILTETTTKTFRLGYLLAETDWGQGYASELIPGLIAALKPLAPLKILGGVEPDNIASARVLQKAGFKRIAGLSTAQTDLFRINLTAH